jgi:hypothetical protein
VNDPGQPQGPWTDLALHTLGWKAFQDLCARVCEDVLQRPVEIYREAQDGGQDAVFVSDPKAIGPKVPATIQCKFSSHATRTLKSSDIAREEEHIEALKAAGYADMYVLMTSMSVSAPVAMQIKIRLRDLGVHHPHVFGKEFLGRIIRSSPRLRALVPRVYGLGDLSIILDERRASQTRALLGHMMPTLRAYVPTAPHVKAVRALTEHKIVLLLGDPASGKSTIAAVLSTIASDNSKHRCYKADGPAELLQNWNPHEAGGFYWIDDAFGPNQLREDYVDSWVSIMPKVQAAIGTGNSFVLTSRRHIYEAAKPKLGSRNHPLFRDKRAIVEVGLLTEDERRELLYNHIKYGNQPKYWKAHLKRELDGLAADLNLTPDIARQIGDANFTVNVQPRKDSVLKFIRSNKEYLLQTVRELSKAHRAALTLVFLHRGRMPVGSPTPQMQDLILRHYGVDRETLADSLFQLRDSFLVEFVDGQNLIWIFKHPTISDALAATLGEAVGMRELYLRGVRAETVLSEVVCDDAPAIPDAVLIPRALDDLLVERLSEVEDDDGRLNRLLFAFLSDRASDYVFRSVVQKSPHVFDRLAWRSVYAAYDPKVSCYARAYSMGVLPLDRRIAMAGRLESDLFDDLDTSILTDERILELFSPFTLLRLHARVRNDLIPRIQDRADEIKENPNMDISPEENFEDLESRFYSLKEFFADSDADATQALHETNAAIKMKMKEVAEIKDKAEKQKAENERLQWLWEEYTEYDRAGAMQAIVHSPLPTSQTRSMFSDVDD